MLMPRLQSQHLFFLCSSNGITLLLHCIIHQMCVKTIGGRFCDVIAEIECPSCISDLSGTIQCIKAACMESIYQTFPF